jgi:uncharacterized protein involved in exopolysaccharide biosynthesis
MRFLSVLLRRWFVFLPILVVLPLAATIYGHHHVEVYQTTAQLYVTRSSQLSALTAQDYNPYLSPNANEANVMNELLQSETFDVQVARSTGLATLNLATRAEQDAAAIRIQADTIIFASTAGPDAIFLTVQDKDPYTAEEIASALITNFQQYDSTSHLALDQQTEAFYQQQVQAAKAQVQQDAQKIAAYLAAHPSASQNGTGAQDFQYQQLETTYTQDQNNATQLQSTLTSVQLDEAANKAGLQSIRVQDPPQVALSLTVPKKQLLIYTFAAVGGALGLILLIAGAMVLLDRKVYTVRDVEAIFTAAGLEIPAIEVLSIISQREWDANQVEGRASDLSRLIEPLLAARRLAGTALNGQLAGQLDEVRGGFSA